MSAYRVHRIPMTALTVAAVEQIEDASTRDAGRAKNLFALGVISWLYGRPTDGTKRWIEQKFAKRAGGAPGEPGRVQRRLVVRRDDRAARRAVPGQAGHRRAAGDVPQRERHDRAVARADRGERAQRAAAAAGRATRSRRPPSCCTSSRATPRSACGRSRPRTRSPPPGMALGAAFGGRLGVTATSGPGMDLKAETIGLGGGARAADDRGRRAARRPVDRHADQDRAVRSADGHLRAPRRVAAAGDRAEHARAAASRRRSRRCGSRSATAPR